MENVVTAIVDEFPDQLRKHKTYVMLAASVIGYLLGLSCVTTVRIFFFFLIFKFLFILSSLSLKTNIMVQLNDTVVLQRLI